MKRRIDEQLLAWKGSRSRKPLIVQGARQVGKTHSILEFGQRQYRNVVHVDFSRNRSAVALFDGDLDPARIVDDIALHFDCDIRQDDTLVFFDEVQQCARALTSLKYFCEDAPQYHVVAAGSLLGVALNREEHSYPVGKVDELELHPLDFEEFCWATGNGRLAGAIADAFQDGAHAFVHHDKALRLLRTYELVGGMPEAVLAHVDGSSWARVADVQLRIENDYIADMTKYAEVADSARILGVWRSLPAQLTKENPKFQYKAVKSGARAREYWSSVEWLKAAGVVRLCTQVGEGLSPLAAFENPDAFKMYLEDTGLLAARLQATPASLADDHPKTSRFRGALAENFVMQQLVARSARPFYWGTTSVAEVDFLVQDENGAVVPIEVKSGTNTDSKSRRAFCTKYAPDEFVTVSAKNFGRGDGLRNVPLYAAHCLAEEVAGWRDGKRQSRQGIGLRHRLPRAT